MNNNHSFNKFSQYTHINCCETYLTKLDSNGKKYTKVMICKIFGISRVWLDYILKRYNISEANKTPLQAYSRINKRYLTQEYLDKRKNKQMEKDNKIALKKAHNEAIKASRYEHKLPNSMFHMDLKLLPPILGDKKTPGQKQYLLNFIDDCTRKAYFEIIDGKVRSGDWVPQSKASPRQNQWQVTEALKRIFARIPCTNIYSILSDKKRDASLDLFQTMPTAPNGKEFKGIKTQHAVEKLLISMGIKHYYTKIRRPQTNGKSERLNRTVNQELLTQIQFSSRLKRQLQLRHFEHYYNNIRTYQGINNLTPNQKYQQLSFLKF